MKQLKNILQLRTDAKYATASLPALMIRADNVARSIIHGEHAQRKSGSGEKFWQFREYSSGDRPQDIDWRQSAKTDHIFIKQKEWQTTQKNYLWCAGGDSMDFTSGNKFPNKQQSAQIITLSLALLLSKNEEQIGFYGQNKTGRGDAKMDKISQRIWDQASNQEPLPPVSHFIPPRNSNLIAAGDFLSPIENIEAAFLPISYSVDNALIVQVLDPAEIDLSYTGRVLFKGLEREAQETVDNVSSIRKAYKQRITDHIETIKSLCLRMNWSYVLHRTDTPLEDTLKDIWAMIEAKGGPRT